MPVRSDTEESDGDIREASVVKQEKTYSQSLFNKEIRLPRLQVLTADGDTTEILARKREVMERPHTRRCLEGHRHGRPINLAYVDLSGLDLSDFNLESAILIGANLKNTILAGANLHKANFAMANLEKATLVNANLSKANLFRANLEGAIFIRANLSEACLDSAVLTDADFSHAVMRRVNLTFLKSRSIQQMSISWTGVDLTRALLSGLNFSEVHLQNSILIDADIRGVNFDNAILSEAQIGRLDQGRLGRPASESCFSCCAPSRPQKITMRGTNLQKANYPDQT